MNSRSILIAGGFCLACTILLGSALLQFAVGSVREPEPDPPAATTRVERTEPEEAGPEAEIAAGQAAARRLETLLRRVETIVASRASDPDAPERFRPEPLSEEAVSLFAEMVQIIDESAGYRFIVVIADSDLQAANYRAERIRSSLLLALRHPSRLQIVEQPSSRPTITVRVEETMRTP